MKLIDIDRFIEKVKKDREHEIYLHSWTADDVLDKLDSWYAPTINAIPIPENATNGDMIKAMFPNEQIQILNNTVFVGRTNEEMIFSIKWWNAPYKGVEE